MSTTWRRLLVPAGLLALVAAGCSGSPVAGTARDGTAPLAARVAGGGAGYAPEGITVVGTGRVTGRPDTLRATVGVEVERARVEEALAAANAAAEAVLGALRSAGVADEDVRTTEVSVHPRHRERPGGEPEVRGYAVTNLVAVTIRDLTAAGDVLDAAVSAAGDAARVHGVGFTLEDNQELLERARESAFADARAKAEQYASLAGGSLGALVSLSETTADRPPVHTFAEDVAAEPRALPLQPGTQEVVVQVTATWALR